MQPNELEDLLHSEHQPIIIDTRSAAEFVSGHIPGAVNAPAWKILLQRVPLPADKSIPLVVTCEHGPKAQLLKGLLSTFGYMNISLLDGHMAEWKNSGRLLESGPDSGDNETEGKG